MSNKWWPYIFPGAYGLGIYAALRLVNDVISDFKFWLRPLSTNATELLVGLLVSYVFDAIIRHFLRKNQQRHATGVTSRVMLKEFAEIVFYIQLVTSCTLIPMAALTDDGLQWYDVVNIYLIPPLFWLLYYAIARGNASVKKSYEQQLHIEKITNDHLQTELLFLKAQYHPHFLFNALNTVYFQMDEDISKAKLTVEKLSELLRYQLYDQYQPVPVSRELEYLKSYIELQKMRMNENLCLEVAMDKDTNGQLIYPLLLLPLVENAFKYAGGDYWIKLEAKLAHNLLQVNISNAVPSIEPKAKKGGIGLENLQRRLALLYPSRHSLQVTKTDNCFTVLLKIEL